MAAFLDNCRFVPTAGGTADWVYASTVGGCQSPALAGAVDGRKYKFLAISSDLTQWEIAEGAYTAASSTFARTSVLYNSSGTGNATGQSGAGTKISFTLAPNVAIVGVKEDLISIEEANGFTAVQQGQARSNISAFGTVKKQIFVASGTYTPSSGMVSCIIECVGAGGGGGGAAGSTSGIYAAAGGGAGSYSRAYASAAAIGASQPVTVGAGGSGGGAGSNNGGNGGDTSVGALCVGKGGSGGSYSSVALTPTGGSGGVAGTGDVASVGMAGGQGQGNSTLNPILASGAGGASFLGGGAKGVANASTIAGLAGSKGGGGSGGFAYNTASTAAGGAGGDGLVVITELCTQ